ncbi:very short patch repair endonuclease [Rhodanobacter sp. Si-c]|uniref:Very short patch repair endonuclease n=1 Tax=Rhodanobacter lycopersici TaxID=3162487 RepID=A0ABV3Q8U6_9GAMM
MVDSATRSRMMSGIRVKHTRPEIIVRKALFAAGFRFRLHRRDLPGAPDIVMAGRKIAIFVHGCFWHQHEVCKFAKLPASRPEFWANKLEGNVARDRRAVDALLADHWRVLTVWECATRDPLVLASLRDTMDAWVQGSEASGQIRGFSTLPDS